MGKRGRPATMPPVLPPRQPKPPLQPRTSTPSRYTVLLMMLFKAVCQNRVFRCVMKTVFLTTYFDVQTQPVVECPRDIGGGGGGGGHDVSAGADAAGAAAKAAPAAPPAPSHTGGDGLKELRGDDAAGAAAKAALAGNAAGAKSDNLGLTSSEDEEARPVRSIREIRKLINIALDTDSSGSSTGNLASLLSEHSAARKQNSSSTLKKLGATNSVPAEHCRPPVR